MQKNRKQKENKQKKPKEVWVLISHFVGIFRLSSNHCFPFSLVQVPDSVTARGLRVLPWDSLPQHYSPFGILSCTGFILLLCSSLPSTKNVVSYVQPGQGISTSLGLLLCFLKRLAPRSPPHKGKALAQHRQGWESSGWVTLPLSHLCSLDSPMTTEPFSFQSVCAMDMASRLPGFLEECSLQYRRQNHGWSPRNDSHHGFLCSWVSLQLPQVTAFTIPGFCYALRLSASLAQVRKIFPFGSTEIGLHFLKIKLVWGTKGKGNQRDIWKLRSKQFQTTDYLSDD